MKNMTIAIIAVFATACGAQEKASEAVQNGLTETPQTSEPAPAPAPETSSSPTLPEPKADVLSVLIDEPAGENCEVGGSKLIQYRDKNADGVYQESEETVGAPQFSCNDFNEVSASITCAAGLEDISYSFMYTIVEFESGDTFVKAGIFNAFEQNTVSNFFAATEQGAASGSAIVLEDSAGAGTYGAWKFSINKSTLEVTVKYEDSEYLEPLIWDLDSSACVRNAY